MPTIVISTADKTTADDDCLQIEFLLAPFRDAKTFSRLDTLARLVTVQAELTPGSRTLAPRHPHARESYRTNPPFVIALQPQLIYGSATMNRS